MPESSPAACRLAVRDRTAVCFLLGGLLNIDSALTLTSFAGRDDTDDFFFVMSLRRARVVGHHQLTDAVLLDLAIRHQGRLATFDRRVLGLLPPDSVLRDAVAIIPA